MTCQALRCSANTIALFQHACFCAEKGATVMFLCKKKLIEAVLRNANVPFQDMEPSALQRIKFKYVTHQRRFSRSFADAHEYAHRTSAGILSLRWI